MGAQGGGVMAEHKKVTFDLTDAQKAKLKSEAGIDINSLTYDALEDRFAPKLRGGGGPLKLPE